MLSNRRYSGAAYLLCEVVQNVWVHLMGWLDFMFIIPPNLFIHWECWSGMASNTRIRKGFRLIWNAAVWCIWQVRNKKIFENVVCCVETLVEAIKVLSWRWSLTRLNIPTCMYYKWSWNLKDCFLRGTA